ncbi:MAG: flippase [Cytophagales bacterium]
MAKSSGIILFFKIGTVGFNYMFFLLLSNTYGASEVGYFALSFTAIQLFSIIARSGLDIGMFKEISYSRNTKKGIRHLQIRSTFFVSIASALILVLVFIIKPLMFQYAFSSETMAAYVMTFLLSLPFYTLMFFNGEIHRAKKRYSLFAIFQNFGMYLLLSIYMLIHKFKGLGTFDNFVVYFIISLSILALLSFWGTFDHSEREFKKENRNFGGLLSESIPIGVSSLCFFLMSYFDGIVIGQFYSETDVGSYAIAFKIALLGSFILISINSALGPRITELSSLKKEDLLFKELRKTTRMGFWATAPVLIITLLIPEQILGVFGEEFQTAAIPLIILMIGQIFNTLNGPTGIVLQLTGHQKVFKNIVLVSSIITIALNYLLIPFYGLVGAAIANSFSLILWNVWCTIRIKQLFGKSFFYLPFFK